MTLHSVLTLSFALLLPLMFIIFLVFESPYLQWLQPSSSTKRFIVPNQGNGAWLALMLGVLHLGFPSASQWLWHQMGWLFGLYLCLMGARIYGVSLWRKQKHYPSFLRLVIVMMWFIHVLWLGYLIWQAKRFASLYPITTETLQSYANTMPTLMVGLFGLSVILPLMLSYRVWAKSRFIRQSALPR
ncbi:MAG: hypothetical protein Q4B71_02730 [Cardiobacteriaceae bacterium]|nr:hypothetical protein [Cardiobacteriaceae bacterium]